MIGGGGSAGKAATIFTAPSDAASGRYTMPKGASPRGNNNNVAPTFLAGAHRSGTDDPTPNASRAALPYFPAGTALGSAIASRPLPSTCANGKLGAMSSFAVLLAGAISTS